jgi:hypothetical protein
MRGDISPLESVGEHLDVDIDMDDNDPTMHVSPAEGNKAPLATDPNTARDELEKSGNFSRRKIRKIMASLPKPSTPNDPLFQPTWIPSHEVDLAFAKLYPKAMYKFASPPAKLPTITRTPSQRSPKTQSPQHPSYRHPRRNAIVPDPGQEPVRRRKTGVNKSSANKSAAVVVLRLRPLLQTRFRPALGLHMHSLGRHDYYTIATARPTLSRNRIALPVVSLQL